MNQKGGFDFSRFQLEIFQGDREDCEEWEQEVYWSKFRVVRFFTVLPKHFHSKLKLPEKFVKNCLLEELSRTSIVSLKGPSGETWAVKLKRFSRNGDEELYLKKGWRVFAEEHNLKENDVLVFEYKSGGSVFDVLVFNNENFCEIGSSYFVRNNCNEGCHSSTYGGLNERRRVEREPSLEMFEPKIKRNKVKPITIGDDDELEDSYSGTSRAPGWKGKAPVSVKPEQDSEEGNQVNPFALVLRKGSGSEKDKGVLFQQAVTDGKRRGMPNFVVILKTSHLAYPSFFMTVPIESARKYIPPGAEHVTLRMNDNTWSVTYKSKGKGFGFCGRGWRDFVSRNKLKAGDVCLFEVTSSNPVIFTVSVFTNR